MKKKLIIAGLAIVLLSGCAEDKKETKVEPEVKVEQKAEVKTEEKVIKAEDKKEEKIEPIKTEPEVKIEQKSIEKAIDKEEVQKEENVVITEVSGEALFKTCASCHGAKGEKKALGKSQTITGWDKQRTLDSLNGYKDGTYGGVMKGIMKPHVESKTPEELEALADFISKLN